MKTLIFAGILLSSIAVRAECPHLTGVYTRVNEDQKREYAYFIQSQCEKLEIKLLTDKGVVPYFSVPTIGQKVSDPEGVELNAYFKEGTLVSEIKAKKGFNFYNITLKPFEGGIVQTSDYELVNAEGATSKGHDVVTWEIVK